MAANLSQRISVASASDAARLFLSQMTSMTTQTHLPASGPLPQERRIFKHGDPFILRELPSNPPF